LSSSEVVVVWFDRLLDSSELGAGVSLSVVVVVGSVVEVVGSAVDVVVGSVDEVVGSELVEESPAALWSLGS